MDEERDIPVKRIPGSTSPEKDSKGLPPEETILPHLPTWENPNATPAERVTGDPELTRNN